MNQLKRTQLTRLNRAEKYLSLPTTKETATLAIIEQRLKELQQKYNLIV